MAQRPKVSRIIILIVIIIIVCFSFYRAGRRCGWIPSKTQRLVAEITEDQMKLEIAPLEKRLSELKNEAKKRLLSESEKKEIEKLKREAEDIRKVKEGPPPPPKPAPAPVYKWIFGFKAEPEDIINAKGKGVDQICYRENDVVNKPYFDKNEIRFKYKTSKGKVIYAILDKKNPSETHFLGMVDLPDQPGKTKGRKLIIRLKESSAPDSFEGEIETWDGINWYPKIPAFLKKVQVQ